MHKSLWRLIAGSSLFLSSVYAAPLNLSDIPLFLTQNVAPLTLLVISKDHKLYYEAYNDLTDLDDDGILELKFKPSINYFGYFDSHKCYSYSGGQFNPISVTANKKCSASWSGNFLNYLTTSRFDALRKVLYGGYRRTDDALTVLERAYIPQDGHSWGKEYKDSVTDGYNISDYTPYAQPTSGTYHLFANTTLSTVITGLPLLRVALNQPYRIWEWMSVERPVADARALNGNNGPLIAGIMDHTVRVKVCDRTIGLESNCRIYPNGQYKPIGLLQEFGENNAMMFGLLTGSYSKNLSGGVLRKNISSIADEINLNTGQFSLVNGIISSLNKLTATGFDVFGYDCGYISNRDIVDGECQIWGNPVGEMMYEAIRYFAGKQTPSPAFDYSGGTDQGLGLPKPGWRNPYNEFPACSKGNMLVISDPYPSYDSDQLPGGVFGSISDDLSPALNVDSIGQKIFSGEYGNPILAFIGQSGSVVDRAPTAKTVSSFGNIRGLAPQEANSLGSYYSASVAHYAWTNDVSFAKGAQNIKTFVVGLSAPVPEISFNVGGHPVTIVPYARTIRRGFAAQNQYQPNGAIVDYYLESLTPTSAVLRLNFENLQQGGDYEMDSIVKYSVNVSGNTISINTSTIYSAGSNIQHMGYVIYGTTADGVYLEVRDADTAERFDVDYFLDTPPGQLPGAGWQDGNPLPLNTTRIFTANATRSASILNSPLWFAAKWGGFEDANNNAQPDLTEEFNTAGNADPDNYFSVTNVNNLQPMLAKAFSSILESTSTFSSAGLSSGFLAAETKVYQAIFKTKDWSGKLLAFAIDSETGEVLTTGNATSGAIWDAGQSVTNQNFNTGRHILTFKPSIRTGIPFRWPSNDLSPTTTELDTRQVNALHTNPVTGLSDNLGRARLNYLRGSKAQEIRNGGTFRDRVSTLGDMINSNPISISISEQNYPAVWAEGAPENTVSYNSFKATNLNRQAVVYVGANDGMLHAFNANTGREMFAYVPSPVYKKLSLLTSKNYAHTYYVDGSPNVIDAFLRGQWQTILVGGLNGGGQGIYALDVTQPSAFNESFASKIVKWEFTDADDADLGFTYSQPSIVRLANGQWGAIFGNGYNSTATDSSASTTGNGVFYIVNLDTGALIKKFDTRVGMSNDPQSRGRPNGVATPLVIDRDGNGVADFIYGGDLFGNVWKIDISSPQVNRWDFSFKNGSNPVPLFIAMDANGNRQPITSKPTVARLNANNSGFQIFIGTGQYLENADKTNLAVQTMYGLRDDGTTPISGRAALQQQTILQESGSTRVVSTNLLANNQRGWYLDLIVNNTPKGERIVANSIYLNQKIIFVTLTPSTDPCEYGGTSWLMELNAFNGTRLNYHVFDINKDRLFNDRDGVLQEQGNDIAVPVSGIKAETGLISTPAILKAGDQEYKYLPGTSGNIQKVTESPGKQQQGRQSWHQLR